MKKILFFASALLTLGMMSSCVKYDNPIDEKFIIVDENGNKYETDLVATFQGQLGSEVSLTLGVYDLFDIYGVDFGDGVIKVDTVGNENGGVKDEDGLTKAGTLHTSATKFSGTIAGTGVIKVYGKSDIWYLIAEGGAMPTSLDQAKLKNVVQMTISGANVNEVVVPYTEALKTFNFRNSPAKKVDVSQAPNLTSFSVENMLNSPYDNNITGVDVSKNTKLEYLYISVSSSDKEGHVESVDLSNNPAIKNVYVSGVHLKNIILPEDGEITTINLSDNELTALDFSKVKSIKSLLINGNQFATLSLAGLKESSMSTLTANNNQLTTIDFAGVLDEKVALSVNDNLLTELDVPVVTNNLNAQNNKLKKFSYKGLSSSTRYLRLQDNELTLATLPVKPEKTTNYTKYFIYAPQADMEVAPEGAVVDLSSQASAQGVLEAPVATVFTVKQGETELKAGDDYNIDNGKITFLKSFQGVVVEMTTEAFPGLILKTKPFDVTVSAAAAAELYALNEGDTFTSGQTVVVKEGVVSVTYGEEGGADFKAAKAASNIEGYTAFTEGNGTNGNKAGGTFYTIKPAKDGNVEVAVVLNADKAFYIEEDGTALADYNGITKSEKFYGTFTFSAKAGKNYKVYCSGSKLGFFGFKFSY